MSDLIDCNLYKKRIETIADELNSCQKLSNKKILITGATGMIGKMLIDVLMLKNEVDGLNCKIIAVGRNKEKAKKRLGKYFKHKNFEFKEADINKESFEVEPINYVMHLASATHPKQYATEPVETITANVVGLNNLLKMSVEKNAERFLFTSSVEVYGENRGDVEEFDEQYLGYINCNTLRAGYPEGKRVGEALCQAYKSQYELDFVTVRLARVFGPTMLMSDSKASSQFIKNALNGEDIVLKSEGLQEYSYLYVADAVRGIIQVLLEGESGEAYNVADEKFNITLKAFATNCAELVGKKVIFDLPSEIESKGFSTATRALMDSKKIHQLGFEVKNDFRECLKETLKILK